MIKHNGRCHCGNLSIETEYDPILTSLCNCSRCRKMFGTVNSGAMFGEQEIVIKGEAKEYTCSGGSGLPVHYFFCPDCGLKICGKYDAFEGFIIIPLGTFDDPHLFRPAAEIFTNYKLDWIKSSSVKESFEEAAVMERIQLLMENLDQREQ